MGTRTSTQVQRPEFDPRAPQNDRRETTPESWPLIPTYMTPHTPLMKQQQQTGLPVLTLRTQSQLLKGKGRQCTITQEGWDAGGLWNPQMRIFFPQDHCSDPRWGNTQSTTTHRLPSRRSQACPLARAVLGTLSPGTTGSLYTGAWPEASSSPSRPRRVPEKTRWLRVLRALEPSSLKARANVYSIHGLSLSWVLGTERSSSHSVWLVRRKLTTNCPPTSVSAPQHVHTHSHKTNFMEFTFKRKNWGTEV